MGIWVRRRVALVALLSVWILGRIALLRLSILRIWVCNRCRGGGGRCGSSWGSSFVLVIRIIYNQLSVSARSCLLYPRACTYRERSSKEHHQRDLRLHHRLRTTEVTCQLHVNGNIRSGETLTHLLPPLSFSFLPDSAARAASEPAGGGLLPASP